MWQEGRQWKKVTNGTINSFPSHRQAIPYPKLVSNPPPFEAGLPLMTGATEPSENEVPGHPRTGHKKPGSICLRTCVLGTFPPRVLATR